MGGKKGSGFLDGVYPERLPEAGSRSARNERSLDFARDERGMEDRSLDFARDGRGVGARDERSLDGARDERGVGARERGGDRSKRGWRKALRERHDGFTPPKQKIFLQTLRETGCVRDACRVAGITSTSAYRTRRKLPEFARQWDSALAMAAGDLEAIAFRRAVEGTEQKVIRNGVVVQTTIKQSDSMLRLIVEGSNPAKYGRRGTVARQLGKKEDEKLRDEIRAEIIAELTSEEQMAERRESILRKLDGFRRQAIREGRYFQPYPDGPLIPTGWRPPEGYAPGEWREPGLSDGEGGGEAGDCEDGAGETGGGVGG